MNFHDPIGPGTPAWNAFDRAIEKWHDYRVAPSGAPKRRAYKAYHNARQYMRFCLVRANRANEFPQWATDLIARRDEPGA
jgi:hypothetical protein